MAASNIRTLATMRAPEPFLTLTQRAVFSCQGRPTVTPLDAWIRQVEGCATTKKKGDHFKELCIAYLLHARGGGRSGIVQAWTLANLPEPGAAPTRPTGSSRRPTV